MRTDIEHWILEISKRVPQSRFERVLQSGFKRDLNPKLKIAPKSFTFKIKKGFTLKILKGSTSKIQKDFHNQGSKGFHTQDSKEFHTHDSKWFPHSKKFLHKNIFQPIPCNWSFSYPLKARRFQGVIETAILTNWDYKIAKVQFLISALIKIEKQVTRKENASEF